MKMMMDDYEITFSYRTAKNRQKQIQVLAELNQTTPECIKRILRKRGFEVIEPKHYNKTGRPRVLDGEKVERLYNAGYADTAIASACGVSVSTVKSWRYQRNLPMNCNTGRVAQC